MTQFLSMFAPHPFVSALCNASVSSRTPVRSTVPKHQQMQREEHAYTAPDGQLYTLRGEPFVKKEHRKTPQLTSQAEVKFFEGDLQTAGVSVEFIKQFLAKVRPGMTTAEVCKSVVLPQTKAKQCSYSALLLSQPAALGQANVFVSHAWAYEFTTCMNVLLEYAADHPEMECFFWFDLFANNQWNAQAMPQEFYATTFQKNIDNIGRVVLVLSPWDSPIPLTRAWCLWEIMCALKAQAELVVRLPKAQQEPFEKTLLSDCTKIISAMSRVQAQEAGAYYPRDKDMIFGAITDGVGFSALNQRVKEKMRAWLTDTAEGILQRAVYEGKTGRALASVQQEVGSLLTQLGSLQRAEEILTKAVNFAKVEVNVAGSGGAHAARAYRLLGLCYRDKSELSTAKAHLERALELYGEGEQEHQLDIASCLEGVAAVYRSEANYNKAFELYKRSLDIRLKVLGMHHVDTAASYDGMGGTCRMRGDFEDAVKYYKQGLTIRKALMGERHPDVGASLNNLGNACFNLHQYQEALDYYSQCLPIFLEAFGEQHLNTSGCYNNIANAHKALGNHEAAQTNCRKALELSRKMFGERSLHTAQAYSNLGGLLSTEDATLEEAETAFEKALEIATEVVGAEHPLIGDIEGGLGDVLAHRGQLERSLHHLKHSLAVRRKVLGPNHPSTAASHEALGEIYAKLNDTERAREEYQASVDAKTRSLGANHASTLAAAQALSRFAKPRAEMPQPNNLPRAFQPQPRQILSSNSVHRLQAPPSPKASAAFRASLSNLMPTSAHAFQPTRSESAMSSSLHANPAGPSPAAFQPVQSQMMAISPVHAFQPSMTNFLPTSAHAFQPTLSQPAMTSSLHASHPGSAPPAFQPSQKQMMASSSVHSFRPVQQQMMASASVHSFQASQQQMMASAPVQPAQQQMMASAPVHSFQPAQQQMMASAPVHAFQASQQQMMASAPVHAFQASMTNVLPTSSHAFQPMMSQIAPVSSHAFQPQVSQMSAYEPASRKRSPRARRNA